MWRIIRENGPIFAQRKKCNFDQNKKKMCKGRVRCGSKLCKIRQFDIALCASWSSKYQISGNSIVLSFLPKNYILAIIKIGSFDPCHDANKKNNFYSNWWQIQKKKKYRFQRQMNQIRLDWKMFLFGILLIKKLPKGLFPFCLRLLFGGLIWTTSNLFNQTGGANIKYFIKYFLSIQKRANKFYQIFS